MHGPWKPDLHLHSTASDGLLTPTELMTLLKQQGLNLVALSDHDTMAGLQEASRAARELNLYFIPAIELSTQGSEEVHLLAYFVDEQMSALQDMVNALKEDRIKRCSEYLRKLQHLGISLSRDDIPLPPDKSFHRAHLAQALLSKGFVASIQEAFDRYLGVGRPAYVNRLHLDIHETIQVLTELGATTVLAHPKLIKNTSLTSRHSLLSMKEAGLLGIEVYHPSHDAADVAHWLQLSKDLGFMVTGGSDFHRLDDSYHGQPGSQLQYWVHANDDVADLLAREPKHSTFGGLT